jgi:hypothetical protein
VLSRHSSIGKKDIGLWDAIQRRLLGFLEDIEQELIEDPYSRGFTPKVMDREHCRAMSPDGRLIIWCVEAFSMFFRAAISNMNGLRLVGSRDLPYDYFVGCAGQFEWKLSEKGSENLNGASYCAPKSAICVHQHPNTPCRAYSCFKTFDSEDPVEAAAAYSKTLAGMQAFVSVFGVI